MNKIDLPKRKRVRLEGYDYSLPGYYFITICTKNKERILGEIVGTDVLGGPQNQLTEYGKVADKYIKQLNEFYDILSVEKYVIMPNHIHLIIHILNDETDRRGRRSLQNSVISQFTSTFKRFCNKEYGRNIWQSRSHDHIIRGDKDYEMIWNYIESNPAKWREDCFYA